MEDKDIGLLGRSIGVKEKGI